MISGPAETPSDWVTTSTPVSARFTVAISSASPAIFSSFGWSTGILRADRASARTECPASRAALTVSRPIPLLAPMIRTIATASCSPSGPAWLTVMCDAGSCTARWAGGLKSVSRAVAVPSQNLTQVTPPPREFHPLALAVIGRRRHLRAEVADEVGGRGRVVGIDADQHAVERRRCMHRGEGCLTVTVEARRSVGRDHVREYPAALRGLGSRRGGHGRDAKNGAETGCRQS